MNSEGKRVILIIDGSTDLRSFGRDVLRKNFHIVETDNGKEGLELAGQICPDLVLCDILVPLPSALAICGELKSAPATSRISVILLGPQTREIEALRAGADDYILHPFDSKVLRLKIENHIRMREVLRSQYAQEILAQSELNNLDGGFLEKLRQVVSENISDPDFGVHDMASETGISVSVLYRKLRVLTGITINEFVKTIRMKKAMQLLVRGIYSVGDVAMAVGYEDSKYFSKEFRKTFGKTPIEIKRHVIK